MNSNIISDVDVEDLMSLSSLIDSRCPDVVVNCIGIIKQSSLANDATSLVAINAFPSPVV